MALYRQRYGLARLYEKALADDRDMDKAQVKVMTTGAPSFGEGVKITVQ